MLKEFEFFHGVVFARILHRISEPINITTYPTSDNSSYILNNTIGLYIKYSSKRMSPWRFTFLKEHQDEILDMKTKLVDVFTLLICNDDGVAFLDFNELKQVLNQEHNPLEWISVARGPREKYEVKGQDGKLRLKIGNCDFPLKLFKYREERAQL